MEFQVGLGPILARLNAGSHPLSLGQNFSQLLLRGPDAGQTGGLGLKDSPQLEQVPQSAPDFFQAAKAKILNLSHLPGHKGTAAPLDLQHPLDGERPDGFPQGGPADPQLMGQVYLVGQLVSWGQPLLGYDLVIEPFCSLLG